MLDGVARAPDDAHASELPDLPKENHVRA
jgi:hypothetical protein